MTRETGEEIPKPPGRQGSKMVVCCPFSHSFMHWREIQSGSKKMFHSYVEHGAADHKEILKHNTNNKNVNTNKMKKKVTKFKKQRI